MRQCGHNEIMSDLNELGSSPAEIKIAENFYLDLYENLKFLCNQEKDSNIKIDVIYKFSNNKK